VDNKLHLTKDQMVLFDHLCKQEVETIKTMLLKCNTLEDMKFNQGIAFGINKILTIIQSQAKA